MSEVMPNDQQPTGLLADIRALMEDARRQTSTAVNIGLPLLYWRIGKRISVETLGGERAAYGEEIVSTLSRQLRTARARIEAIGGEE